MATIAQLSADLVVNSAKFTTGMHAARKHVSGLRADLQLIKFDSIVNLGEKALHYTKVFYDFAKSIASAANDIERNAKTLNMSIASYQEWMYVAKMADLSNEDMMAGFKFLTKSISEAQQGTGDAAKAFDILKISLKDSSGKTKDQQIVLLEIIDALNKYADGVNRDALMLAIFGRSWMNLKPLINEGTDAIKANSEKAKELGVILGDNIAKAGGEAEKSFKRLEVQMTALKLSFAPAAKEAIGAVEDILSSFNRLDKWLKENKTTDWFPWLKDINAWLKENSLGNWLEKIGIAQKNAAASSESFWTSPYGEHKAMPAATKIEAPILEDKSAEAFRKTAIEVAKLRAEAELLSNAGKMPDWREWLDDLPKGMATIDGSSYKLSELYKRTEEENRIAGELAQTMADDMFPAQEKVNQIVDQGSKYWEEQNRVLSETKGLIEEMDWESMASGITKLSSDTERAINMTKIATEKFIDEWNKTKDVFASIGDNISSVWATNMSKMITDAKNWKDALDNIWKGMADTFISALFKMATNWALFGQTKGSEGWSGTTGALGSINTLGKSLGLWGGTTAATVSTIAPVSEWGSMTWLQHGGVINKPSVIGVGEAGPEAVIPLKDGAIPIEGGQKGDTHNYYTFIEATDVGSFERKYGNTIESIYARGKRWRKVSFQE